MSAGDIMGTFMIVSFTLGFWFGLLVGMLP